jgi:hypothetical protein
MIPEKNKTYLINYFSNDPQIPESAFYKGPAIYTGNMCGDLFAFDIPGEGNYNLFAEEDIVSEVKETIKEVWNGNANC